MFLSYFTLLIALILSTIAAWYSILGLTAIFASAAIPIIIMGGFLEVAKITVTIWLHEYWHRCRLAMKMYLVPAVISLMLITSLGVFGFLSKAHSDQSLVSGDVQSKIAIYDEKIKTEKENIEANRKALKQMDEGVDQVLGRSKDEKGADRAVRIRLTQQKERIRLQKEISQSQQSISKLNDARAPIAAEVRKVEAEVGPIKYIAAVIYGDNPDVNLLERAVRWVIILLVIVFDPLAIMMVLAATESLKWERGNRTAKHPKEDSLPDKDVVEKAQQPKPEIKTAPMPSAKEVDISKLAYLNEPFVHFKDLKPMPSHARDKDNKHTAVHELTLEEMDTRNEHVIESPVISDSDEEDSTIKTAKAKWKKLNPTDTLKHQRIKLALGDIDELPWKPRETHTGFGVKFPADSSRGDTFVKTDRVPSVLYKFNGSSWIEIDKNSTDVYTYDTAYIDHLISKIESGEYELEILSETEREQVLTRLTQSKA